jgi:hypothetical protein
MATDVKSWTQGTNGNDQSDPNTSKAPLPTSPLNSEDASDSRQPPSSESRSEKSNKKQSGEGERKPLAEKPFGNFDPLAFNDEDVSERTV